MSLYSLWKIAFFPRLEVGQPSDTPVGARSAHSIDSWPVVGFLIVRHDSGYN